jgi:hypothetical protein
LLTKKISVPEAWCKGHQALNSQGFPCAATDAVAVSFSLDGALLVLFPNCVERATAESTLRSCVRELGFKAPCGAFSIARFNDSIESFGELQRICTMFDQKTYGAYLRYPAGSIEANIWDSYTKNPWNKITAIAKLREEFQQISLHSAKILVFRYWNYWGNKNEPVD